MEFRCAHLACGAASSEGIARQIPTSVLVLLIGCVATILSTVGPLDHGGSGPPRRPSGKTDRAG